MATAGEKFALKLASDAGRGVAVLLAGIGDRLGLFAALAESPADGVELAARSGVHPRYAREWLHTMAAAGYVVLENGRYALPPAQAEVLAAEGGPIFMGGTLQMLLGMLPALGPLREAFRSGKGIAPATYPDDAWEGMERDMAGMYEHKLVAEWLPRVPAVRALLETGVEAADIGCGRGRALFALAKAFPRSRYVGYDAHAPNVAKGSKRAAEAVLADRVRFEARDASNQGPLTLLRWGFSLLYCMSVSLAEGGEGLGTYGLPESRMRKLCADAGFSAVRTETLSFHVLYEAEP